MRLLKIAGRDPAGNAKPFSVTDNGECGADICGYGNGDEQFEVGGGDCGTRHVIR